MRIIKDNRIIEDDWRLLEDPAAATLSAGDRIIVPYDYWLKNQAALLQHEGALGICISGADRIEDIARELEQLQLIALHIPAFTDGRCYSHARLLRDRYHYTGEIRATGDILRDQLFYLQRCGVNSFQVRADKDITEAMQGLADFTVTYQTAADGALPVSKNR